MSTARTLAPTPVVAPGPPVRARGRANPALVLAAIWVGAAAVVGLWWQNTASVQGLGGWLTNAGRITGLLAGYGIVVLLVLVARIPSLDRGVGSDRLAHWHAMGGRYSVSLVVAHALLIWWGYAVTAHSGLVPEGASLLSSYPDVLMATVAGFLLLGIGVVSARAARARMRYETWFYLHFYTYLAVALAFSHQFSTGAEFVANRQARVFWSALYLTVAVLLVWNRFLTPVRQALRHDLRVQSVRREGPGVVSVYVEGRGLDRLNAEPGQFFRWRFLTKALWWAANPYSLSAPVDHGLMRVTVKDLGDHSRALAALRPGTRVAVEGPYGAFTAGRRRRRKVLLLGAGVGITPLRALFETLPGGSDVTFVYRATSSRELVLRHELDAIAAARGSKVHYLLGSRAQLGYDPLHPAHLSRMLPGLREHDVYLCGPEGMTAAARQALRSAGVPRRHIHHESFEM